MATPRKVVVDPLTEELPPEPRPRKASDITFEVQIAPYVVSGRVFYRWNILGNSHKTFVSDYAGHTESGFANGTAAEQNAADYVDRIRYALDLKLNVPDAYTLTL